MNNHSSPKIRRKHSESMHNKFSLDNEVTVKMVKWGSGNFNEGRRIHILWAL